MNNRIDLAKYFNKLGFKIGAEIGVAKGHNAKNLCKYIPGLKLYCIDPYKDHPGSYEKAKDLLRGFNVLFVLSDSSEAAKIFDDNILDFVFIDGDHRFDYVMEDLIIWSRKVRSGGIIAGHDYYHFRNSGVVEAVNIYTEQHKIDLMLTTPDPESEDDKKPSFYFFKP